MSAKSSTDNEIQRYNTTFYNQAQAQGFDVDSILDREYPSPLSPVSPSYGRYDIDIIFEQMTQSPKTSTPKSSTPKAPTSGSSPAGVGSPSPIPLSASFYGSGPSPSLRSTPPISPSIWQRPLRQVRRRRAVPTSPPPITPPSTPRGRPSRALRRGGGRRRRGGPGRGPPGGGGGGGGSGGSGGGGGGGGGSSGGGGGPGGSGGSNGSRRSDDTPTSSVRRRYRQQDLLRELQRLQQQNIQKMQGRQISGVTHTNTITTTYKDGGRPSVTFE